MKKSKLFLPLVFGAFGLTMVGLNELCREPVAVPEFRRLDCPDQVHVVSFSPDGKTIAAGTGATSGTGNIKLWNMDSVNEPLALIGDTDWINCMAFAPDGRRLAAGSYHGIMLWDLTTRQGERVNSVEFFKDKFTQVAFSSDMQRMAAVRPLAPKPMIVVGSFPPRTDMILVQPPAEVMGVTFSADGKYLAAACIDDRVRVYETCKGVEKTSLPGRGVALAFAPDGALLASCQTNGDVGIWDLRSGQLKCTLAGHKGWIYCLAFSPDGSLLASGNFDGEVKLWDVATGVEIGDHQGHNDTVNSVAFSPDGKTLASGSADKTVLLWKLNSRIPAGRLVHIRKDAGNTPE